MWYIDCAIKGKFFSMCQLPTILVWELESTKLDKLTFMATLLSKDQVNFSELNSDFSN